MTTRSDIQPSFWAAGEAPSEMVSDIRRGPNGMGEEHRYMAAEQQQVSMPRALRKGVCSRAFPEPFKHPRSAHTKTSQAKETGMACNANDKPPSRAAARQSSFDRRRRPSRGQNAGYSLAWTGVQGWQHGVENSPKDGESRPAQ